MASKRNVWQTVITVLGAVVSAVVAVLLVTPFDSGETPADMLMKALPALALGVAAGVATIFAARLLDSLGRKVWRLLRTITPTGKLRALALEIKGLHGFQTPTGPDAPLLVASHLWRCDELMAKLEKLDIPALTREQFVILRSFLAVLYDCAIRGAVEEAKTVLERLSPEIDVAKLSSLAQEIKELHDYKKSNLAALARAEDLEVSHYLQRCDKLRDDLCKLDIPLPPRMSDTPSLTRLLAYSLTRLLAYSLTRLLAYSLTRLLAYSLTRLLAYSLASLSSQAVWVRNTRGRGEGEGGARTPGGRLTVGMEVLMSDE